MNISGINRMEKHTYSTIRLSSWHEFKLYSQQFSENWAFRGQAHSGWVLSNAIERTGFINFYQGIEAEFLAEFQRGARNYLSKDETPAHLIEWLALMQHHDFLAVLLNSVEIMRHQDNCGPLSQQLIQPGITFLLKENVTDGHHFIEDEHVTL